MDKEKQIPDVKFKISGFSEDPKKRAKEFEEIRERVFKIKKQNPLNLNKEEWAYYRFNDGRIFKREKNTNLFYMLNKEKKCWDFFPPLQSIYYDTSMPFEEFDFDENIIDEENMNVTRRMP